jgi:exosome complex RNA-binding protein Rrp42 (RNase PH superfamily)
VRGPPFCLAEVIERRHRQSEEEGMLSRMLDKVLRRSDVVDKEALCVRAGERVRLLFCSLPG